MGYLCAFGMNGHTMAIISMFALYASHLVCFSLLFKKLIRIPVIAPPSLVRLNVKFAAPQYVRDKTTEF